jgi:hypothetical protein
VRGAHHDALENRLSTDERLLAALQGGQQLGYGLNSLLSCFLSAFRQGCDSVFGELDMPTFTLPKASLVGESSTTVPVPVTEMV